MNRDELVLAALAADGQGSTFTPVQVQKLFFLIDREAAHLVDGPHFHFRPYDYGPFDKTVYSEIDALASAGKAVVHNTGRYRMYALTNEGHADGQVALTKLPKAARDYFAALSPWIRGLSFEQLVASVYNKYPDMKVNSIFRG